MSWPRRTRDDHGRGTLRMPPGDERFPTPHAGPGGYPSERRERTDSYWTFLVLGLAAPFGLAVPLYTLAWYPVWYFVLPVAGFLWAAASSAQTAPPPPAPGGPLPWDLGPLLSPQVALTWAVAVVAGWFVLSRLSRRRRYPSDESPARRGFRGGLKWSLFVLLLLAVFWANRTLAGAA